MIRVLVAEDSATARALLVSLLEADPEIEVVGQARDGVEAVELAVRLRPDLVTMDLRMPRMDGLEATSEIMIQAPTPIVIVTAVDRFGEVEGSLEMLARGALDVLRKPSGPGSPGSGRESARLVATVKAMARVKVVRRWRPRPPMVGPPSEAAASRTGDAPRARAVAIAASTGGPAALRKLFSGLAADFAAPILVVQHITPGFAAGLAGWLDEVSPLRVKVAEAGEPMAAGTAYLAPDGHHLGVDRHRALTLSADGPVDGFCPSATPMFESVAAAFGASAVGVILTGMGDDGVKGLRALRRAGGRVIAQDEATSVVHGMPGAAVEAGLADAVLPLDAIAGRLAALAGGTTEGRKLKI